MAIVIVAATLPLGAQAEDRGLSGTGTQANSPDLTVPPFSGRLFDNADTVKTRAMMHDWQDGYLMINATRAKSTFSSNDRSSPGFRRYSAMATDIGIVREISGRESISAGLSYALESRRPGFNIAAHNVYRTGNMAATLAWTRDSAFRLGTSIYTTRPLARRNVPERLVEIAGDAPLSAHGVSLTASHSPIHNLTKLRFGIELKGQRMSEGDAAILGRPKGRSDARVALFYRKSF
jgi:hypothetical protein